MLDGNGRFHRRAFLLAPLLLVPPPAEARRRGGGGWRVRLPLQQSPAAWGVTALLVVAIGVAGYLHHRASKRGVPPVNRYMRARRRRRS